MRKVVWKVASMDAQKVATTVVTTVAWMAARMVAKAVAGMVVEMVVWMGVMWAYDKCTFIHYIIYTKNRHS